MNGSASLVIFPSQHPELERSIERSFREGTPTALSREHIEGPVCVGCPTSGRAWIIAPPAGGQPIYYGESEGSVAFGTRFDQVSGIFEKAVEIDASAVLDFFTYEHVLGDRTFLKAVRVVPPGCVLATGPASVRIERYAPELPEPLDEDLLPARFADLLAEKLDRSIAESCAGHSRIAVTLSGGLDSRAIIGFASRHAEVDAVTFGSPGSEEVRCAARVARVVGARHEVVDLDPHFLTRWLDRAGRILGGMVAARHFHILHLAEALAGKSLVLDGMGGDALTGAHLSGTILAARDPREAARLLLRQRATICSSESARRELFDPDFLATVDHDPGASLLSYFKPNEPAWRGCHRFDLLARQQRMIQCGPELTREIVPVALPFYGSGLPAIASRAPARTLAFQRSYLLMHRRHLGNLAALPDATRGVPVGWPLALRFAKRIADTAVRKLGLSRPAQDLGALYSAWFRGPLRSLVEDRLVEGAFAGAGILNPLRVREIASQHLAGTADYGPMIGCLLSFHSWLMQARGGSAR